MVAAPPQVPGYELERELGSGATARVFEGKQTQTGTPVALKVFHAALLGDERFQKRIESEVKAIRQLEHPNIVKVVDQVNRPEVHALALELVKGENLLEFQKRLPFVLPEVSVLIVIEILKGLEFSHAKRIIHRDLKPSNILISEQGRVCVTDFGLAKLVDATKATISGTVLGSPDYMSPEQSRGDVIDEKSDLFSVTAIFYFLVTGTSAFLKDTPFATLAAVNETEFESPRQRNPKLSYALARMISRGFERDPKKRFQSAAAYREALESYLSSIGLAGSAFSFKSWLEQPHHFVTQSLKTIAENLARACEKAIAERKMDQAHELLAHFSSVAPSSELITKYSQALVSNEKKGASVSKGILVAAVVLLLSFAGIAYYALNDPAPPTGRPVLSSRPSKPKVDPVPKVKEDGFPKDKIAPAPKPQKKIARKTTPPPRRKPQPRLAAKKRESPPRPPEPRSLVRKRPTQEVSDPRGMSAVRFNVPSDVRVKWEGQWIKKGEEVFAMPGRYELLLYKAGFDPIRQYVNVKAGQPTTIRVGGGE